MFAEIDHQIKLTQSENDPKQAFIDLLKDGKALNAVLDLSDFGSKEGCTVAHAKAHAFGLLRFYAVSPTRLPNKASEDKTIKNGENFETSLQNAIAGKAENAYDKILVGIPDETIPVFNAAYRITITKINDDKSNSKMDAIRSFSAFTNSFDVPTYKSKYGKNPSITYPVPAIYNMTDDDKALCRRVYLEFSWPVNTELPKRNRKIFVREYYYNIL